LRSFRRFSVGVICSTGWSGLVHCPSRSRGASPHRSSQRSASCTRCTLCTRICSQLQSFLSRRISTSPRYDSEVANASALLERAAGVPDYSSPESLSWMVPNPRPAGFGMASDIWSAGVIMYMMLCGFLPFRADSPAALLRLASSGRLDFPKALDGVGGVASSETVWARVSPAAKAMAQQLLQVDPSARPTAEAALNHPWVLGEYNSRAVRASVAALRGRSQDWKHLQPDADPGFAAGTDSTSSKPAPPRQIRQSRSAEWDQSALSLPASARSDLSAASQPPLGSVLGGGQGAEVTKEEGGFGQLGMWLRSKLFPRRQLRVLLLGLDAAGKSTLLARLRLGDDAPECSVPTIGHDVECFEHGETLYTLYDVGGQRRLRGQWERYFGSGEAFCAPNDRVSGVVFVIDAADHARLAEAKEELHRLIAEPRLQGIPLLILANKLDLPAAMPVEDLASTLAVRPSDLPDGARCEVRGACTLRGEGVIGALEWIQRAASEHAC